VRRYIEGVALWNAIKSFVDRFLAIHYLTDAAVAADPELAEYRAAFAELLKCPEVGCCNLNHPGLFSAVIQGLH